MKHPKYSLILLFLCCSAFSAGMLQAQSVVSEAKGVADKPVFTISNPDYTLSPHTGMTRAHWADAARYLLEGAFGYINELNDPMKFPKQPGKSYPHNEKQVPTEKLEGLCRTLFVAAPLLKENPALELGGIKVAEYYRHQIGRLLDPDSPSFIPHRAKNGGPSQILVEFGALAISLFVTPETIWDPLSQEQKDKLAATMISYGDGPTVDSNWKFFNIFVLSFFKEQGYAVNEALLEEYLEKSLAHYRGNGWYNDSPAYDFYSMWAFQLYGILWSELFGKEYYPRYASRFQDNFKDLNGNYPYLFSEDGNMIMWGRSISYRFASISPFPFMGFLQDEDINWGWMRRIASGTLLQFMQNPGFMEDGVPTLGFYGHYEPAVQVYSCRGSVYWMGKAFLGLLVPADNPFWTATENEGPWEDKFDSNKVYNNFQEGSNILITDYPAIGAAEVRAWCHEKVADDWQKFRSTENYNRLSYNSAFPWQADGEEGAVAMNYVFRNSKGAWEALRLYTFKKFEEGVYYRDVVLETNDQYKLQLADIPLPNGILRIDRNISTDIGQLRLGHYALPQLHAPIRQEVQKVKGYEVQIIDNGSYQLAMVPLEGWEGMEVVETSGLNPVSEESKVINVSDSFKPQPQGPELYATLMLWKKSGEQWTDEELVPVKSIKQAKSDNSITVLFRDQHRKVVRFE
ncbi:DUF2264 domain-containing protein [Cesiribacter sp. SM1]|uniref:DUF2264 domain-containing protein n=1 Tax=Cesiribacter sp. SM1 TaxID=2861196 RepID=UPI001CD3A873|nr:DUF2264 domain-containing protein [Cesiribacter sp. SM1]